MKLFQTTPTTKTSNLKLIRISSDNNEGKEFTFKLSSKTRFCWLGKMIEFNWYERQSFLRPIHRSFPKTFEEHSTERITAGKCRLDWVDWRKRWWNTEKGKSDSLQLTGELKEENFELSKEMEDERSITGKWEFFQMGEVIRMGWRFGDWNFWEHSDRGRVKILPFRSR